MIILGVSRGRHDGSATLLVDNKIVYHLESERLSNLRHDRYAFQVIEKIKNYVDHVDYIALTGLEKNPKYANGDPKESLDPYTCYVLGLGKSFFDHGIQEVDLWDRHHEIHASTSFYNSGFDRALCIVKDGQGSRYNFPNNIFNDESFGYENGSVFIKEYPNETYLLKKHISVDFKLPKRVLWTDEHTYVTNSMSEAVVFEKASELIGLTMWDAGKTMGLSSYGKKDAFSLDVYKEKLINEEIFGRIKTDSDIKSVIPKLDTFQEKANFAYKIQKEIQEHVAEEIIEYIKETKEKNICLSGGFFLNCVSNYNLLKKLPKGVNIYIEPMSTDGGNSLGAAKFLYYHLTQSKEISKQINLYYGPEYKYTIKDLNGQKITKNINKKYVANLIANKKIVALFQGKSEAGHRALGNRSILYDPRDANGKDHVNIVKKREFFRPFAGTILEEHSKDWFDMKQLDDSKFMMYAVDVLKDKQRLIPAITHIDGTCRVQTVSKKDNKHYYELINEFYKITNVPILLNTSFNLAGNAIVETIEDALKTLNNSEIDYLYLPELKVLVEKGA
jgi:carbamoyltransferase